MLEDGLMVAVEMIKDRDMYQAQSHGQLHCILTPILRWRSALQCAEKLGIAL